MRIALLCNDDITTNIIFSKVFSSTFCTVAAVYFAKSPLPSASNSLFAASYLFKKVAFPLLVIPCVYKRHSKSIQYNDNNTGS